MNVIYHLGLDVVPRHVVRSFGESGAGREVMQGGVRAMEVIVVEEEREAGSTMVAGVIRAGISPFTSDGLDEAFSLAIGLRAIGTSEEVTKAQIVASGGEEFDLSSKTWIGLSKFLLMLV